MEPIWFFFLKGLHICRISIAEQRRQGVQKIVFVSCKEIPKIHSTTWGLFIFLRQDTRCLPNTHLLGTGGVEKAKRRTNGCHGYGPHKSVLYSGSSTCIMIAQVPSTDLTFIYGMLNSHKKYAFASDQLRKTMWFINIIRFIGVFDMWSKHVSWQFAAVCTSLSNNQWPLFIFGDTDVISKVAFAYSAHFPVSRLGSCFSVTLASI